MANVISREKKGGHENEHAPIHSLTNAFSKKTENHVAMIALFTLLFTAANCLLSLRKAWTAPNPGPSCTTGTASGADQRHTFK